MSAFSVQVRKYWDYTSEDKTLTHQPTQQQGLYIIIYYVYEQLIVASLQSDLILFIIIDCGILLTLTPHGILNIIR